MRSGGVAVITGASSGIGRALALEFASRGFSVGLVARREPELHALAAEVAQKSPTVSSAVAGCDVSERLQVRRAFADLKARLGPPDVVVANAGVGSTNTVGELKIDEAEQLLKVNLFGVMYVAEAVLPDMLAAKHGRIVAVSSLAAYKGLPGAAAYCASKAAVNAYFESLRIQHLRTGVKFQLVCPGFVRTPMTERQGAMMFAMDAAPAAKRMARAILRGTKVYNFPWPTYRLTRLTYWLPERTVRRFVPDEVGGHHLDRPAGERGASAP